MCQKLPLHETAGPTSNRTRPSIKRTQNNKEFHRIPRSHVSVRIPTKQKHSSVRRKVLVKALCENQGFDGLNEAYLSRTIEASCSSVDKMYHFLPNFLGMTPTSPLSVVDTPYDLIPLFNNVLALVVGFVAGAVFVGLQMSIKQTKRTMQSNTRQALAEISILDEEEIRELLGELPSWLAFDKFERGGWINKVVSAAWPYLDEATSNVIVGVLDPILQATRPSFLTTLRFERFSFGSVPATIEGVKVYENTGDAVEIDLQVFWAGDPNVILGVRAAQDTLAVPVSLTEIQCKFTLRLIFAPLIGKFPCFGALTITLTEEPELDFDLRVVGGDITLLPGLAQPLRTYIKALICSYLVWPRCITVPIPGTGYSLPAMIDNSRTGLLQIEALSHDALSDNPGELGLEVCWPGTDIIEEERVKALPDGMMLTSKPISLLVNDARRQVLRLKWYSSIVQGDIADQELELQSEATVVLDDLVRLSLFNEAAIDDIKGNWGPVTIAVELDPVDLKSTVAVVDKRFQRINSLTRKTKSVLSTVWNSVKGVQSTKRAREKRKEQRNVDQSSLLNETPTLKRKSGAKIVQLTLRYQPLKSSMDVPQAIEDQTVHTLVDGYRASSVHSIETQVTRRNQVHRVLKSDQSIAPSTLIEQMSNTSVYFARVEADVSQALERVQNLSSSQKQQLESIVKEANQSLTRASTIRNATSFESSDED